MSSKCIVYKIEVLMKRKSDLGITSHVNSKYHLNRSEFAIPILPRKIHLLVNLSKDADEEDDAY